MKYILEGIYEKKPVSHTEKNLVNFKDKSSLMSALQDLYELKVIPTEIGVDVLLLAEMVFLADVGINRNRVSEDGWTRRLHLIVPVYDVSLWSKCAPLVKEMLDFLTGDVWSLEFKERNWTLINKPQESFSVKYSGISLFSGGLDSLVGAVDHLSDSSITNKNLFVSFAGDGSISKKQEDLFNVVSKHYGNAYRLRFQNIKPDKSLFSQSTGREDTTRSRSFLFIALTALAGSGFHNKIDVLIPENGIMSLNVPLTTMRLGALSTRTTHPFYIELWNNLFAELGFAITLKNPYWNKTKGEMLKECKDVKFLQSILSISSSCAHPASARWSGKKKKEHHCGYCVPCIIRRSAIYFAFTEDPTKYTYEFLSEIKTLKKLEQIQGIKYALYRLEQSPSLSNKLIHGVASLGFDASKIKEYDSLYKKGMKELADFFAHWGA